MSKPATAATVTPPTAPPLELRNFAARNRRRVYQPIGDEPSKTRQEFTADCDINNIMKRYQRTGAISHFAKYEGSYGDFSACDLQEAQNLLNRARLMFDELPSTVRQIVGTPAGFLDFVQDPKNADRMAELGLTRKAPAPSAPAPGARSTPAPAPSEGA